MTVQVQAYRKEDLPAMQRIWNQVVETGLAFPQESPMDLEEAERFFSTQSFTGVAVVNGQVAGLYILHPNNVGRCAHIANASYAVASDLCGTGIGEALVRHSLEQGKKLHFRILQFNAVAADNRPAIHLYEKLGFVRIGIVPGGFRRQDDIFQDILLFYHSL